MLAEAEPKKSKKSEKKVKEELEEIEVIDFTKSKKSKKPKKETSKKKKDKEEEVSEVSERPKLDPNWTNPYTYEFLWGRIDSILQKVNPYKSSTKELHVKPIALEKVGRQYKWTNFKDFCLGLKRSSEHLSSYISAEMGIHVICAEEKLIMEGRAITQDTMQSTVRGYIHEYVICKECNGTQTDLIKKPETRLLEMICGSCTSCRTVENIKSATSVNVGKRGR